MLLERLYELSQRLEQDPEIEFAPTAYNRESVRWLIELATDGKLLGITALTGSGKNPERGKLLYVPALAKMRTVAVTARLLCDNGQYVLGLTGEGKKPERVAQCHQLFRELTAKCAAATGAPEVQAVAQFLEQLDIEALRAKPNGSDVEAEHTITFSINGMLPVDLPSVRAWWAGQVNDGSSRMGQCIVTGEEGPVVERLPQPIKGIPGGQVAGMPLISMNARAFESYGLEASYNAPISPDAAERCGKTLNWLLASDSHRKRYLPDLVYVFWLRDPAPFDVFGLIDNPTTEQVKKLFNVVHTAELAAVKAAKVNRFYATGLSASGSRVVIRDWIDSSLRDVQEAMLRFFEAQQLVDPQHRAGEPVSSNNLCRTLYRDPSKESTENEPVRFLRLQLKGGSLPNHIALQALQRNTAERGVNERRVRLLKLWLCTGCDHEVFKQRRDYMTGLDPACKEVGYVLGRLLAVWDAIQGRAQDYKLNTTMADSYFGAFGTMPRRIKPRLEKLARHHLKVLRRDHPAAYTRFSRQLQEVNALLSASDEAVPSLLSLRDRALFTLGFYHQQADDRRRRDEAKAKLETKPAA